MIKSSAAGKETIVRQSDLSVRVAVVIPCFNVEHSVKAVVSGVPAGVGPIYCVDDCSRDRSVTVLELLAAANDRVRLVRRQSNGGVGAAFLDGMTAAIADGAQIIVKLDGDGQMNGAFIPDFVDPILSGEADFVKGNRFFDIERVLGMPFARLAGNAGLSFT